MRFSVFGNEKLQNWKHDKKPSKPHGRMGGRWALFEEG
jgi:hypothetical protein